MGKYRNVTYDKYYEDNIFGFFFIFPLLPIIFISVSQEKLKNYIKQVMLKNHGLNFEVFNNLNIFSYNYESLPINLVPCHSGF